MPDAIAVSPLVRTLTTITISARDPESLQHFFCTGLGWRKVAQHALDEHIAAHWGIAPGSAGSQAITLAPADTTRGQVRIVAGRERSRRRPIASRFAGIEMIVPRDLDALYEELRQLPGITVLQPPIDTDWSEFGSNLHRAFILSAHGGTHLAFTMGLTEPAGRSFPTSNARAGHVFELPLVTTRFDRARAFYVGVLGMQPVLESRFERGFWHRIWKLPEPTDVQLHILKGNAPGTGLGAIELTGYPAEVIDDDTPDAWRFDGGACMITYDTTNIDAVFDAVSASRFAEIVGRPLPLSIWDERRAFVFRGPDGERVEIVQAGL
ncbi:MAG: VOC family protein [Steroidobacteraceae bacterium]